jgi:uncharacterized membrane protein YjjP (DUF1212 family)
MELVEPDTGRRADHAPAEARAHADQTRVLRIAMGIAAALLRAGAQSEDVERAVGAVARAYGLAGVQGSVTFTGISISSVGDDGDDPITLLHVVSERTNDFDRLAAASALLRQIELGQCSVDQAELRLVGLASQPPPYAGWVAFVAPGLSAAASTVLYGGSLVDATATLGIGLVAQPARRRLELSGLPPFFRLALGAALSAGAVAVIVALGAPVVGGLVLTGSLLVLLPGYPLVAGFRDLIDQSIISGTARLAEALLLAAGVAAGTAVALGIAASAGVHLSIASGGETEFGTYAAGTAAFVSVAAHAVTLGVSGVAVAQAAALGGLTWLVFIDGLGAGSPDGSVATFGSAVAIGIIGRVLAARAHAPIALWVVPAILPLLPGLQMVQAMLASSDAERVAGLAGATVVALLVGTGVASGDILVSAMRRIRAGLTPAAATLTDAAVFTMDPLERIVGRRRERAGRRRGDDRTGPRESDERRVDRDR